MFWHNQNAEPDAALAKASRGCLSLPDVGSFYAKVQKPSRQRVYGPRMVKFMLSRMVSPASRFLCFSSIRWLTHEILCCTVAGEAAPETLAQGPDMVVQELVEIRWESDA